MRFGHRAEEVERCNMTLDNTNFEIDIIVPLLRVVIEVVALHVSFFRPASLFSYALKRGSRHFYCILGSRRIALLTPLSTYIEYFQDYCGLIYRKCRECFKRLRGLRGASESRVLYTEK